MQGLIGMASLLLMFVALSLIIRNYMQKRPLKLPCIIFVVSLIVFTIMVMTVPVNS